MQDLQTHPTHAVLNEAEYQRLVQRFDRLWEHGTSDQAQREMQRLIGLIEEYEAAVSVQVLRRSTSVAAPQLIR